MGFPIEGTVGKLRPTRWWKGRSVMSVRMFILGTVLALTACAPRPTAQRATPHPDATILPVYVATTRALARTGPVFGAERAVDLNFFRTDISVPPDHRPGQIEWPEGPADALTDFVVTNTHVFESGAAMARAAQGAPDEDTLVFVHGYNNTLSEALYRLTQIQVDFDRQSPPVLFSWPSAGDPRGYVYDRDSILFARDDLENVLQLLTKSGEKKVTLLAHSVGSQLVMEVLRQAALRGDQRLLSRISSVTLISPDIDPDVFRRQAEVIGTLPQPFLIFVSREDYALDFSGFLNGWKPRLGVVDSPDEVADLDVQVVDFTALSDGEGLGHFVPVTSPTALPVLKGLIRQGKLRRRTKQNFLVLE